MALIEALRTEKALHLRNSVTGRMQALITIHDQYFNDGTGLVAVEEPARLDGVEGFARKADRMRHIIRYGDDGTRRWYPRRLILSEYVEFGRPEYWTGTQWNLLPMGQPTVSDTKLVWDRANYALTVQHNWHRVKLDVTLKSSAAARRIRWQVTLQGLVFNNWSLISQSDGKTVGYINKPTAEDANGKDVPIAASYAGGYVEFNADLTGAVFPVTIDPTLTLQPDAAAGKDAFLDGNDRNRNYGVTITLQAGTWGAQPEVALCAFDLSSLAGATVSSGTFTLNKESGGTGSTIIVNRLAAANEDWVEGTGDGGTVTGANCFNYKAYDATTPTNWAGSAGASTSGTDYSSTLMGSASSPANGNAFNIALLASEFSGWPGATKTLRVDSSSVGDWVGIICTSSDGAIAANRPQLAVEYTTGAAGNPFYAYAQQ